MDALHKLKNVIYKLENVKDCFEGTISQRSNVLNIGCLFSLLLYKDKWEILACVHGPPEWIYWKNFYENAVTEEYLYKGLNQLFDENGFDEEDYESFKKTLDHVNTFQDDEKDEVDTVPQRVEKYIMRMYAPADD